MSRERPILFNGAMVRAILAGQKTQTRRAITPQPYIDRGNFCWNGSNYGQTTTGVPLARSLASQIPSARTGRVLCPFGKIGDRLWVRESFRIGEDLGEDWEDGMDVGDRFPIYQADGEHGSYSVVPQDWEPPRNASEVHNSEGTAEHWRSFGPIPSIHMPRWACRLALEITDVRVERLQAMPEADWEAEGISFCMEDPSTAAGHAFNEAEHYAIAGVSMRGTPEDHGMRAQFAEQGLDWDSNPWVWVIEFKQVTP
ncbi:hypothetical protein [Stenotrophomonas sp.]|uniref:hypothetical protein n=1 Tax=Stenotrophomonas sp. TaxID=69392 RepID=UPI0028974298|nr:hypothetical protein [Stenotrophomonas sp.]